MTKFYSTWNFDKKGCKKLSEEIVIQLFQEADEITIFSAYYSQYFLHRLLKKIPTRRRNEVEVTFVFNGFVGRKLNRQKTSLSNWIRYLEGKLGFTNINIHLNTQARLFHTKLFHFRQGKDQTWLLGSANASEAGFNHNEELLLALDGRHPDLESYVAKVIENSEHVDEIQDREIDELITFWRSGLLFFKPNAQIQFTFNALDMPPEIEEILSEQSERPRNTNPGTAWGAYNIKRTLGLHKDEESGQEQATKGRVSIGRWSVETCFGFWVPTAYVDTLHEKIWDVAESKRDELEEILAQIYKLGEKRILEDYEGYLDDVKGQLSSKEVQKKMMDREIFWKPAEDLIDRFKKFLRRLVERLKNEPYVERVCDPYISTDMPEIWSDSVSVLDFSNSFFDYIEYRLQHPSNSLVVHSISKALELNKDDNSDSIKKKMEEFFEEYIWTDDDWLLKVMKE